MKKSTFLLLFIWFLFLILPSSGNSFGLPWDSKKRIDAIRDRDGDTRVECEHAIDEDKIRLYTAGVERITVDKSGNIIVDTDALYYDKANKRWGIGTTNPTQRFDVSFSDSTQVNETNIQDNLVGGLYISNDLSAAGTEQGSVLMFDNVAGRSRAAIAARHSDTNLDTSEMIFYTHDSLEDIQPRVIINKTGNVGIATMEFGSNTQKVLGLGIGQAPTSAPADMVQIWGEDLNGAGTCGLKMMDELGNIWTVMGVASSQ
ncbi:MAG: hypothetical protein DRI01_03575, partial [Chloroflexi bacterium]